MNNSSPLRDAAYDIMNNGQRSNAVPVPSPSPLLPRSRQSCYLYLGRHLASWCLALHGAEAFTEALERVVDLPLEVRIVALTAFQPRFPECR